jgi:hypothetical protein
MAVVTVGASNSIAASATTNVALGTLLEFQGVPAVLNLWATSDAAAATIMTVQLLVNVGATQIVPIASGTPVNIAASAGLGPKLDEDQIAASIALPAGSRVQLNVTNPLSSGAVVFRWRATLSS